MMDCDLLERFQRGDVGPQADNNPKVAFEAVRMKDRRDWNVAVTLCSGKQKYIGSFDSEKDAREWISCKSVIWLKLMECDGSRYNAAFAKREVFSGG
jgi:hypothetical protein